MWAEKNLYQITSLPLGATIDLAIRLRDYKEDAKRLIRDSERKPVLIAGKAILFFFPPY